MKLTGPFHLDAANIAGHRSRRNAVHPATRSWPKWIRAASWGLVTDPSGAVIGGATVTLTNEGTSATLSTTVESDGSYKFTPVRIGSYKLTATSQGFQTTDTEEHRGQRGIVCRGQFCAEARRGNGDGGSDHQHSRT